MDLLSHPSLIFFESGYSLQHAPAGQQALVEESGNASPSVSSTCIMRRRCNRVACA